MTSRQLINLVSVPSDTNMRMYFGRHLPGRDDGTVVNARTFPNGVYTPRITMTNAVSMSEYALDEYVKDHVDNGAITIFVYNSDSHIGIDHVRMVASADYTVEVSGINPGGMRISRGYIHASGSDFDAVWKHILKPNKGVIRVGSAPAVGHWG